MAQAFKYYRVFLSQSGTGDPTARDVDNTLGRVVWTRTGVGTYTVTKENAFRQHKTVPLKDVYVDIDENKLTMEWTDMSTLTLKTYAAADTTVLADDVLSDHFINIESYF